LNTNMGERLQIFLAITSIILLNHVCWTRRHEVKHFTSTYMKQCYDDCIPGDNDYFWCNTEKGWDYCS
ncbi:uncharacterized protein DAT39_012880, partial [Clarias magur]